MPDLDALALIDEGFNVYLPFWLVEAFTFMETNNRNSFTSRLSAGRIQYYDLGWQQEMSRDELDAIRAKVQKKMRDKDHIPTLPVGARILSPHIYAEFLNYLKDNGFQQVRRLYDLPDKAL